MAWIYLVIAGMFEWGWPVGLKFGLTDEGLHWGWIAFAAFCMLASGACLLIAQKTIPMGTAYAVWTGIGAVGAFVVGVTVLGEQLSAMRVTAAVLIVAGLVLMKLSGDGH